MNCPTCGSERPSPTNFKCSDPIHDLADHAPELLEALEDAEMWLANAAGDLPGPNAFDFARDRARAAIDAAKGGPV